MAREYAAFGKLDGHWYAYLPFMYQKAAILPARMQPGQTPSSHSPSPLNEKAPACELDPKSGTVK